ncbi:MAG: SusD/RagB family nutrient-binding outer membrane lipoprotein [Tannerella sp.]|jgi:hypothetical protein|nr:SusD/RagB family nutrient-binding outer membrane lipoprotein [Tannerella sp.]
MKISKKILLTGFAVLCLYSCHDFDELNQDPTKVTVVNPNTQLTYVELSQWGDVNGCYTYFAYVSSFVQQLQGEWNATQYGGLYRKANNITKLIWDRTYCYSIKNLIDILDKTDGNNPQDANIRSITRILKVYNFMILTDLYGDIPYFEGGKGYSEDISTPAYDRQELIYKDFLKELREAEANLNGEGGLITGDIIFNGDINLWKKFANSLRLRTAMRMVYADPATAKSEVADILARESGLLESSTDAVIIYLDINTWEGADFRRNALAQSWRSRETYPNQFICSVFWNHLKDSNDPRLFRLARCYEDTPGAANDPFSRIDLTEEIMELKGWSYYQPVDPGYFWYNKWPSGYTSIKANNRWQDKGCRPQVSNAFLKGSSPGVLMTCAEVQFLLAEAKTVWDDINTLSAEQHYTNGVNAAMTFLSKYGISIPAAETQEYLSANPFPAEKEDRVKAINEQLWILHLNNPPEAYANWRRSGYPVLKPAGEYGAITIQSNTIPRRLCYPDEESLYNAISQRVALDAMGGEDNWNAKVWWDSK